MRFENLGVWSRAKNLSVDIYRQTAKLRDYGFRDQITRSGLSISSNIAEGYDRGHRKEYVQFLYIARGSCSELETLLSLSRDLGYITTENFEKLYTAQDETARLLRRLITSLSVLGERS